MARPLRGSWRSWLGGLLAQALSVRKPGQDRALRPFRDFARNGWPLRGSSGHDWWVVLRSVDGDDFSARYGDLLTGSYDCVDRIVLNAYYPMGHAPGGFRVWWRRLHNGSDEQLDDNHLMRMAGRFARRVKAWGGTNSEGNGQAPVRRLLGVLVHRNSRSDGQWSNLARFKMRSSW